jgi:hypothetical protein
MKNTVCFVLMVVVIGLQGCSVPTIGKGHSSGVEVIFDGEPLVFDATVVFMGTVVGRIISREMDNGVARVSIAVDEGFDHLKKTNLAAVVKNGRLHLNTLCGYGDPLPAGGYIIGFLDTISYRWFKLRHLINNINMSADRRAQRLLARSGRAG